MICGNAVALTSLERSEFRVEGRVHTFCIVILTTY